MHNPGAQMYTAHIATRIQNERLVLYMLKHKL